MLDERFDATPAELAETADRLANWGRWARGRERRNRALSAEGRYRPKWSDFEDRRTATLEVDTQDASIVDRCLSPFRGFPARRSRLLKEHFVYRADRFATCRRMAIHRDSYDLELHRAMFAARAVLTRRSGALTMRAN